MKKRTTKKTRLTKVGHYFCSKTNQVLMVVIKNNVVITFDGEESYSLTAKQFRKIYGNKFKKLEV